VRATEQRVARIKDHPSPKTDTRKQKNELLFKDLSRDLSRRFGTRVSIRKTARKGHIQIEFYSDQDLDRIIFLLRPN
jgi:ParB family chromosome partitioning protein